MLLYPHASETLAWAAPAKVPSYTQPAATPSVKLPESISGQPVRIVIPIKNIDLPVDEGRYDDTNKSWTLSTTHAEFAISTMPANDQGGTTFIYGHGTYAVFGKLGADHPPTGSLAQVHTDNHHVFIYALQSIRNLKPSDTSILRDISEGPPRLIIQTCTGAFSEWRTEFIYGLQRVE